MSRPERKTRAWWVALGILGVAWLIFALWLFWYPVSLPMALLGAGNMCAAILGFDRPRYAVFVLGAVCTTLGAILLELAGFVALYGPKLSRLDLSGLAGMN